MASFLIGLVLGLVIGYVGCLIYTGFVSKTIDRLDK